MAVRKKYKPGINKATHQTLLLLLVVLTLALLFFKIMFF
jgi:hypothetical protein